MSWFKEALGVVAPFIAAPFVHNENIRNRNHDTHMANMNQGFAREQMEFQERMSSTAKQREMADLKKAGLNPLLAATGGAPMAMGASGTGGTTKGDPSMDAGAISSSALGAARLDQSGQRLVEDIKNFESIRGVQTAQKNNLDMDTLIKAKDLPKSEIRNKIYDAISPMLDAMSTGAKNVQHKDINKWQEVEKNKPKVIEEFKKNRKKRMQESVDRMNRNRIPIGPMR